MAFTISTIYKAVDKFTPIVRKMEKVNSNFAKRQNQSFRQMGGAITNVKNQLIGLAGGFSIVAVAGTGARAVVDFDAALRSLGAITGVTGEGLDEFKIKALEVAKDTKESAVDILKAFELVGSAKPELLASADALGEVSKQAIILGKAGKLLPEDAVNALTISLNQFGAGADQAAKFTDILATAQQKGSGTINYLSEAIVRSGGTMKAFGNSFEDTVAILEGFAKAGVPAAEAGTMLSGIMAKLAKSQKKEFNPQFTKATDIIQNLADANLSYADLMKLTDDRGAKWLTQIINQNDVVQKLTGNLNEQGNALAQANTQTASFAERLKQLRARFENLVIKGNDSSGALNKFGKIIGWVTDNLDTILTVLGYTIAAVAAYKVVMTAARVATLSYNVALGLFMAFQKSVPIAMGASTVALRVYSVASKAAAFATKILNLAFKATPIGWIILGVTVIIGLFRHMAARWEGIKKAFSEGGFLEGIKAIGKSLLTFLLKPVEWILKAVAKITGAKWATSMLEGFENFTAKLDTGLLPEEPINTEKTKTERYEEVVKQKLEIELNNKTDKKANVNYSGALPPYLGGSTW